MALQPSELAAVLHSTCNKSLSPDSHRTLAARLSAGSVREAARRLFVSERAFRDRLAAIEDAVLLPCGLERDIVWLVLWACFHAGCCARGTWELIAKSAVFPAEMTSTG